MIQTSLFDTPPPQLDLAEGLRRKDRGQVIAMENRASLVVTAREIAVAVAKRKGVVSMDDIMVVLVDRGFGKHCLLNAAGSVFRDKRFEWTGKFITSERPHSRGNQLRVWRLK